MSKRVRKLSLAIVIIYCLSLFAGMPVGAANYPSVIPESYSQEAYVGETVEIVYNYFPVFANEKISVFVYDENDLMVASAERTFYNTTSMVKYTVTWDTMDCKPGKYKVVAHTYFYTYYEWHENPTTSNSYVTLFSSTYCDEDEHTYGTWETVRKASCTSTGKKTRKCSTCGKVENKTIPKSHKYTSKIDKKATTSANGKITYTCSKCGDKYTESIAKISSIKLSNDTYTYNGNVKQPTVTVKDSKGNKLKNGTDYTVKYSSGRKNVGKYTVTVTFKGEYSGTKKLTFKIKPKSTSISKLTAGTKKFTATWKKQTTQVTGYQLEYSRYSSMKNAGRKTYTTASKNTRTVSGLKAKTKYYVRVRTYKNVKIDGQTYRYYSAWSSIKQVKTK